MRGGEPGDLGAELLVVLAATVDSSELRVIGPLGVTDHLREGAELRRAVGRETNPPVRGGLDRRHVDESPDQLRLGTSTIELRGNGLELVERDGHGFERRHVDEGAPAARARTVQRCECGHSGNRAGDPFADASTGGNRRLVLPAATGDRAAPCLQRELGCGAVRPRTAPTEPRDRGDDQGRHPRAQFVDRATQPGGHLARMTRDDDVGGADEPSQFGAVFERVGIEDRAPLRRVQHREERGLGAEPVTVRRLDLDHVGTGIGEQFRAVRARDTRGEVDDAHVGQGKRSDHGSLGNPNARSPTMLRWIWCDPP